MHVLSLCPLRVASLEWQTSRGVPVLTVVAKATYHLAPATCSLADEQEDPNEYESHWNYDPERSLHSPSDLVPYKPRPEVTLVGQTFAPRGEPVARLTARLIVGSVDKSVVVHAPRSFSQEGALRLGARFTRMPLRYERAAGGPDTSNPVGVAARPDALGAVALPNLEPTGLNVTRPDEIIEPVGFGPLAAEWPARQMRLGRHAGSWSAGMLRSAALPDGIQPSYFLSAPADQLLDELRANERLVLENLHPDHPRLVTSLPGYEPRAFVERSRAPLAELVMVCDTLWIDTDRSMCTLTWRAQLPLEHAGEDGRVLIAMEMIGRPLAASAVEEMAARSGHAVAPPAPTDSVAPASPDDDEQPDTTARPRRRVTTVHDLKESPSIWPAWLASRDGEPAPAPEGGRASVPPAPAPEAARPPLPSGDFRLADVAAGGTGTMDVSVPKQVIEAAIARAEATRLVSTPPPVTPWAPAAHGVPGVPVPPLATPVPPVHRSSYPEIAPALRVLEPPPVTLGELRQATERGAAAASTAAAAGAREAASPAARPADRPAPPPREPPREHVDLLWYDPAAVARILADRALGAERPEPAAPRWIKDPAAPREPPEAKDRRSIHAVVSRGKPLDEPAAVDQVASSAYRDDGTFAAPLVLVAGELSFDFDEVETLRAILTVTAPFLGADKKLREVAANAAEALKAEGRLPGDIASGLTRRVEEAFAQGQRSVAPGYLDASVERILLEGRRYARKTLFGEPRLRALLAFPGGSAPIPTYLPEALATRLPLFRRFKARAIVELRPQEDQYETHPDALLVLALGRVLRRGNG